MTLKHGVVWSLLGSFSYAGAQWFLLIIIARTFGASALGSFAFWLSIVSPISLFCNLKLRAVIATDANGDYKFSEYIGLRLLSFVPVFVFPVGVFFFENKSDLLSLALVLLIVVVKIFDSMSDLAYGYFQRSERHDYAAISKLVKSGVLVLFVFSSTYFFGEMLITVSAWAFGFVLSFFLIDVYFVVILGKKNCSLSELIPSFDRVKMTDLLKLSWPMGLATALGGLSDSLPKYFIGNGIGEYQLGLFAACASLTIIFSTVFASIAQVATPRLAIFYSGNNYKDFEKLTLRLTYIGSMLSLIGVLLAYFMGEWILKVVYGSDYQSASDILTFLMIVFFLRSLSVFFGTAIQAMRNFSVHYKIDVINIFLLLGMLILFVKDFGLYGVLWALIFVSVSESIFYIVIYRRMRLLWR